MPKSSIAMSEFDGEYVFDINQYLIDTYPSMNLPSRRGVCDWVRERIDEEVIEEQIDEIVSMYALEQQGWTPPEKLELVWDDDDSK